MGGTQVADLAVLGDSAATLVIGASLDIAAGLMAERIGMPDARFPHVMGLTAVDALVAELVRISGAPAPTRVKRQRSQPQDTMLGTHFMLGISRFALAADADLLAGFSDLPASMGAATVAAAAPSNAPALRQVHTDQVKIGDLEDLEHMARELRAGFPLYDQVGGYQRLWIGYQGSRNPLSSEVSI